MIFNNKIQGFVGKALNLDFQILNEDGSYYDLNDVTDAFIQIYLDKPETNEIILEKDLIIPVETEDSGICSVTLDDTELNISSKTYKFILSFNFDTDDNRVLGFGELKIEGEDTERIQQIKRTYGLSYDNYVLSAAYTWAKNETLKNGFEKVVTSTTIRKDNIKICNNVVDANRDGTVNSSDFVVKQYMTSSPYTVEDITENIDSITLDHPDGFGIITFDDTYPQDGFQKLTIEYYRASKPYSEAKADIELLEDYYTLYRLFDILEPHKLQHGMSSKELNGVSLSFDQNGIEKVKENLSYNIQNQKLKVLPFTKCQYNNKGAGGLFKSVLISKGY